jgi:hypothetical protein
MQIGQSVRTSVLEDPSSTSESTRTESSTAAVFQHDIPDSRKLEAGAARRADWLYRFRIGDATVRGAPNVELRSGIANS